jgi:hypothetical protein
MPFKLKKTSAQVKNWNPRVENHGDEPMLASDVTFLISAPAGILAEIAGEDGIFDSLLWNADGMVRDLKFSAIAFDISYEAYKITLFANGGETTFGDIHMRKFKAYPKDGRRIELKFQVQIHPTPKQVEALGQALMSDHVTIRIEAQKNASESTAAAENHELPLEEPIEA